MRTHVGPCSFWSLQILRVCEVVSKKRLCTQKIEQESTSIEEVVNVAGLAIEKMEHFRSTMAPVLLVPTVELRDSNLPQIRTHFYDN